MSGSNVESSIPDLIDEKLKKYDDEDMIWIYNEVLKLSEKSEISRGIRFNLRELKDLKNIGEIKSKIKRNLERIDNIDKLEDFFQKIRKLNNHTVSKNHFIFLKGDERLCYFAVNYLQKKFSETEFEHYFNNPYLYIIYHFTIRDKRYHISDINKINDINFDIIKKNYHNNSKNFDDQDFLEWAYHYLIDRSEEFKKIRYRPKEKIDYKNLIVSFLDYLLYSNKNKHYLLTNQLYKAWSQKKFRAADKLKKQYHLPLTKGAKSELKKLSEFKNKTENEILEELIHQMYLSEMCDEDGKLKY